MSDEELMEAFGGGDVEALSEIIQRHGSRLFGFLYRLTGGRESAEDAYQDVFLRVVRAAEDYRPTANFTSWLYTIARNVAIDHARREKIRITESLDDPIGEDGGGTRLDLMAHHGPTPEDDLRGRELAQAIEEAFETLSAEQKEVVLLRERAGLPFKEIAEITGVPLNTVKTRMHYALGHLRKALSQGGFLAEEKK